MSQVGRKRKLAQVTDRVIRGKRNAPRGQASEATWQFLQNLVLVGLIEPRSEELKRIILVSPPTGPKMS